MDIEKIFHMNGGDGEKSYAKNSTFQRKALDMVKHITINTIKDLYLKTTPDCLSIADLGCSSGPNTLSVVRDIIEAVNETSHKISRPTPEIIVFLNDLPTNDFSSIFTSLSDFSKDLIRKEKSSSSVLPSVFISAMPGSFYGRLFPTNSLHFVHSSHSLHWLSRVPPGLYDDEGKPINKGHIYISESSLAVVSKAYLTQFQQDFSVFLQSRSEELIPGGQMVLLLFGRNSSDHSERGTAFLIELFARCMAKMVSKGKIDGEKLDSYDIHFYNPCKEEIEYVVKKQESFTIDTLEMFEIETSVNKDGPSYGTILASSSRAIQEPMIRYHLGGGDYIDEVFDIYAKLVDEELAKEAFSLINYILVLRNSI